MRRAQATACLAFASLLSACGGPGRQAQDPAASDALRVAITSDIRGLNPGVTRDGNTDMVLHHVAESLVGSGDDLSVALVLAKSVETSPDHKTYSFRLREGVRFHNGAPLTAAAVQWSWRRYLDPKTGFRCRSWYDGSDPQGPGARIVAVEAPDASTVVFRLDRPNAVFLEQMASLQCLTAVLHPDSVDAKGVFVAPIATGPYRIGRWKRGDYVELERFAGYRPRTEPSNGYGGARVARAAKLRFVIVPEPTVGEAALRTDDLDIVPRVPLHMAESLRPGDGVEVRRAEQLYWSVLLLQTNDPLLGDIRIRRALAHAIDAGQVAAIASLGQSRANPSAIPRISPFHTPAQDRWPAYDPAAARALLKAGGYRGQVLTIQTNRRVPGMFDNAVAIQAMLASVGVKTKVEVVDWATQLSNYISGDFQLQTFGYSARTHPVLSYSSFTGSKARNPAVQWENPAARALLAEAARTADPEAQQALFDQLHALMAKDVPIIGLYNETGIDLIRRDVRGYVNSPLGHARLWGVAKGGD